MGSRRSWPQVKSSFRCEGLATVPRAVSVVAFAAVVSLPRCSPFLSLRRVTMQPFATLPFSLHPFLQLSLQLSLQQPRSFLCSGLRCDLSLATTMHLLACKPRSTSFVCLYLYSRRVYM